MADQERHQAQADHNRELARLLVAAVPMRFKDWAVVAYGVLFRLSQILRYLEYEYRYYDACAAWMPDEDARDHVVVDLDDVHREALRLVGNHAFRNSRS